MLISCPNCKTNFSVPDTALGAKGRTLKCARCGHKWHQSPSPGAGRDSDFGLEEDSFPPPPPRPSFSLDEPVERPFPTPKSLSDLHMELDERPGFRLGSGLEDEPPSADLDLDGEAPSRPIPGVFEPGEPARKKGTGGLWLLLALLVLGGVGGAGYVFQDRLVEVVPEAGEILTAVGLRHEVPGAGLELRKAGTPERFVHNDTEVLIVRGIIANVTDRERPVPTMKLELLDKDKNPVQFKLAAPPVTSLDPNGTAGFKIMLDRPDPNAVEVNVLFVDTDDKGAPVK